MMRGKGVGERGLTSSETKFVIHQNILQHSCTEINSGVFQFINRMFKHFFLSKPNSMVV